MRLELTARHIPITPALRRLVEKRLAPTLRVLNDNAVSAQVVLTKEKSRHRSEVTLHVRGDNILHAQGAGPDVATSLGAAADRIDRQAQRLKGKWEARKRRGAPKGAPTRDASTEPIQEVRVIRARRYPVKPMSIDEAAMDVGNTTDAFVVFRNTTDDAIAVLFRRPDGNLGLIEPEG